VKASSVTTRPLCSVTPAVGRIEKYQIATAPPTSTIAASRPNFHRSSRVRRASGKESSAPRMSRESER
jgi:hypothetical protein